MLFTALTPLLCLSLSTLIESAEFWGYGRGVSGLPLMYSDGIAYLGLVSPPNASITTNVTLVVQDASDGSFRADPVNSTISTGNWTSRMLSIDTSTGAFAAASFSAGDNATLTTTGFDLWGSLLIWVSESGDISTKWYATPVDQKNKTWILQWNVDNASSDTAVPIVLKSQAPVSKKAR